MTDVVLEEESKEDADSNNAESTPVENNQYDVIKEKAPSERLPIADVTQPTATLLLGGPGELNADVGQVWRSRARSDGSQCRRPGLVPFNQNLLQQLRIVGQSPDQSLLRPPSLKLEGGKLPNSLAPLRRPLLSSLKCATRGSKPSVYPYKQVECPF